MTAVELEAGAWLLAPSVGFVRDTRGRAWLDSLTERTLKGRPKRVVMSRISSYADQVVSSFSTDRRDARFLVLGIARYSSRDLDALASFDPDEDGPAAMARIDEAIEEAKRAAGLWWLADRGTCVHAILEWDDRGEECPGELLDQATSEFLIAPEVISRLRANWRALLRRYGLRVVAIEQTLVCDEFNAAGTLDRLVELTRDLVIAGRELAAGEVVVLDVKTSSLWLGTGGVPAYWGPYAAQIYLYAAGVPYLVGADGAADRRTQWPWSVNQTTGLIGHVNLNERDGALGACNFWHVDIDAGRELVGLSQAARRFEARRDIFTAVTG